MTCPNSPVACMCADCDLKRKVHLAGDCPAACSLCSAQVLVVERGEPDDLFRLRIELPVESADGPYHLALTYRHVAVIYVLTRESAVVHAVGAAIGGVDTIVDYFRSYAPVRWPRTLLFRTVSLLAREWARVVDRAQADSESTEPA